jgi:GNAT superfamily N-acetyltransferase
MSETVPILAVERQSAEQLIERVFGADDIARDYPLVFGGEFEGSLIEIESEGEVRSTCAILVRDLVVGPVTIRAGLIGSVSTDPRSRGRGLATEVLDKAEAELRRRGAVFAMLWAEDMSFYAKRGWRAFGCEHDCAVPPSMLNRLPTADLARAAVHADRAAIHALYSRHTERVDRSLPETSALLTVPGMETLVHVRGGAVVAYACLGRGRDLAGVIHEWGGAPDDVLALVRAHLEARLARGDEAPLFIMAAPSSAPLVERLRAIGARHAVGVVAIGKILDLEACAALAAAAFEPAGSVSAARHPARAEAVELRGPRGACALTREDLLELLFAARADTTLAEDCARTLGAERGRLPLTPFVWGLDSI